MNLKKIFEAVKEKGPEVLKTEHGRLTSTRLWVLLGFVGLLIWFTRGVLTEKNIEMVFRAALWYMAANTASRVAAIVMDGLLKMRQLDAFMKDGKLSAREVSILK